MGLIKWAVILLLLTLAYVYIPTIFGPKLDPVVEGFFNPKFRRVAETIRRNVESGKEKGGALTVYHEGSLIIDMWWGYADEESRRRWANDVMTMMFSSTKAVAGITIAKMVDKGWLEYDKPVATYWPEFAQNGKEKITVEQLLSHQAGLISVGKKLPVRDLRDNREEALKLMEQAKPAWVPGEAHGYHGITFGMYVDTLAQKADPSHRNMTQIFQEEIAVPLGIDIHLGLPKTLWYRMARGHDPSEFERLLASLTKWKMFLFVIQMMFHPDSNPAKAFNVLDVTTAALNDPDITNIGLSSFMGVGTAHGLAKLYSFIATGGTIRGKQLLSDKVLSKLMTPVTKGTDAVIGVNNSYAVGTSFKNNPYEKFKGQVLVGHPGYGGQVGFADPTNQLSLGYLTNYREGNGMWDDPRYLDIEEALYGCFYEYINSYR